MGKNKSYTEEFKREAVVRSKAVGVTKACEELGIASSLLYNWRQKYGDSSLATSSKKLSYEELLAENNRLQKESNRLKKEIGYIEEINKVLKKSTAIFSSDHIKNSK